MNDIDTGSQTFRTARAAFDAFAHGWATGDFLDYIDMLAPDMEFWSLDGAPRRSISGSQGRMYMTYKCLDDSRKGKRLKLHEPYHIAMHGNLVSFEFQCESLTEGDYWSRYVVIAFETRGYQIVGFREYYGRML